MTTPFTQKIQNLAAGTIVQLFEIDLTSLGGTFFRWTPSTDEKMQPIVWRGNTYQPAPISASGFEMNAKGQFPRPKLQVSNVLQLAEPAVSQYNEMLGCTVTRWRVFAENLDHGTEPDPNAHFPVDIYSIDRRSDHNAIYIEWELASVLDQQGKQLPARQILRSCSHTYRVWDTVNNKFIYGTCPYSGTACFDINGNSTTSQNDVCSKQFGTGCKKRFGTAELPFQGFLGIAKQSQ
jgi:lambda family phage minor tail protein L